MIAKVLISLALLCLPIEADAQWFAKVFRFADEAGELADAGKATARAEIPNPVHTLKVLRQNPHAHLLLVSDNRLVLFRENVDELELATIESSGALAWAEDVTELVSGRDILVPMELVEQHPLLVNQVYRIGPDSLRVVRPDGSLAQVRRSLSAPDAIEVEMLPDLYATTQLIECCAIGAILDMRLDRSRLRVVSLLDDSDAAELRALDEAIGEWHVPKGGESTEAVLGAIQRRPRDTIFLVGHIEAERIVVRDAAGHVRQSHAISALESAAKRSDSTLILLGCRAAVCSNSAGFTDDVNALNVAMGIRAAVDEASLGEALSSLARHGGELSLNRGTVDALNARLEFSRLGNVDGQGPGEIASISVATLSPSRANELSARFVPGIPSMLQYLYIFGFFVVLIGTRRSVRHWRGFWKPAPRFARSPVVFTGIYTLRMIGYLLLMPLSAIAAVLLCAMPWLALATFLVLAWPVTVVSAWSGRHWYDSHRDVVSMQPWYLKWLAVPVMCVLLGPVILPTMTLYLITPEETDYELWWALVNWSLSGALSWLLASRLRPWLVDQEWVPARGILAVWYFPLTSMETLINRLWWNRNVSGAR